MGKKGGSRGRSGPQWRIVRSGRNQEAGLRDHASGTIRRKDSAAAFGALAGSATARMIVLEGSRVN